MNSTVLKVALAGLLHDIGKFMQRAELPLSESSKGLESSICKLNKGYYTHRHVLWTNDFFEMYNVHRHLGTDFNNDSIANLAAYHHNPATWLQRIIQIADSLSSGSERQKNEDIPGGRENYKKARLHSIFDYIKLGYKLNKEKDYRYELKPMDGAVENIFPVHLANLQPAEGENISDNYSILWDGFRKEFESIDVKEKIDFVTVVLSLLEKYTWCIPSSTIDRPDISLFDHAKTTAAIASALYLYHKQNGNLEPAKLNTQDKENKFCLLVGDLSGIQDYIFNIRNVGVGGTAKRLRSRSFYLSIMAEVASHALLHAFGLPLTNLVIASGGKFYLLLPNIPDAEIIINKFKTESAQWLIQNLNGEIALNIASISFSCEDFKEFHKVLKHVNDRLQTLKETPFSEYLINDNGWQQQNFLLSDNKFEQEASLCPSCRKFPGIYKKEEDIALCSHCKDDIDMGTQLSSAVGVQFFQGTEGNYPIFGNYSFSIMRNKRDYSSNTYLVYQFNDWDMRNTSAPLRPRPFANHIPVFDENLCQNCKNEKCPDQPSAKMQSAKFFNCLAAVSQGRKMLGILKADVDNLGLIFIKGFDREEEKCISRIITLSRLLENFFTGRLEYLLQTEFKDIYTIFSGGDDLLVLGPWHQVLLLSFRIREEFRIFTCHNSAFTLSAGLEFAHPHLPVYTAVGGADELLDKAKTQQHKTDTPKDQLAVFDDVIKWDALSGVHAEANRLAEWQAEKKISMGFVRQLLVSSEKFRAYQNKGETKYLQFVPMLAYSISRNISGKEKELIKWAQELTDLKSRNLQHLAYIANYSIQTNRS